MTSDDDEASANEGARSPWAHYEKFASLVAMATNETQTREAFIGLAASQFAETHFASDLAVGAEYRVEFKEGGVIRRGHIDSFFGNLIIEFEANLAKSLKHAVFQLRGYVAGAWTEDGSAERSYLAVASDGLAWEVYTPTLVDPYIGISTENVELKLNERFVLEDNFEDFDRFLNRLFFRRMPINPTASNFTQDFGVFSPTFVRAEKQLLTKAWELEGDSQFELQKQEWSESLRIAYGSRVDSTDLFVRHTYLASLARLLVFVALERRPLRDTEYRDVLRGQYFRGRRLSNLAEDDFFTWYAIPSQTDIDPVWQALSKQMSGYDLAVVKEDILKPLYESLVDPETRHDLGEFYTPDWLANEVTSHLMANWNWSIGPPSVLDPACGSGTFLRSAIAEIRSNTRRDKEAQLAAVVESVVGIDVHPLAVIIARATYALAISDLLDGSHQAVSIPVFLSNSLDAAEIYEYLTLWGDNETPLAIGTGDHRKVFSVPSEFVRSVGLFDWAVDEVVEIANSYAASNDSPTRAKNACRNVIRERLADWPTAIEPLAALTAHLVQLIRVRQDSIWGFLLRNRHRPVMIRETFDYVIGNPPWLTIAHIAGTDYRELVLRHIERTQIASRSVGQSAHTELGTIFIPQAFSQFLRRDIRTQGPSVGFVLPRSVMTATHHHRLREGSYIGNFRAREIWDLNGVSPLFNVPACVLFLETATAAPNAALEGRTYTGRLPSVEAPRGVVDSHIEWTDESFILKRLAKRSAWAPGDPERAGTSGYTNVSSAYEPLFRQGAIIYPQTLFVVEGQDGQAPTRASRDVRLRTSEDAASSAKKFKDVQVNHLIETECCFATLAAKHIAPWVIVGEPWTAVIPLSGDPDDAETRILGPSELRERGLIRTADWLTWVEQQWASEREAGSSEPIWERIDYNNQLSKQFGRSKHVVVYAASGSRVNAAYFEASKFSLPFIARDKTYWASFTTKNEAAFVTAFLNSDYAYEQIEEFMTRGLLGRRDVHKRVVDVPFPRYDKSIEKHRKLSDLSHKVKKRVESVNLPKDDIGDARSIVRSAIPAKNWTAIETLVAELSAEHSRREGQRRG